MLSEDHVVFDVYHVHDVLVIMLPQVLEDLEFHTGLVVILLLVFDDFQCYFLFVFVVITFHINNAIDISPRRYNYVVWFLLEET